MIIRKPVPPSGAAKRIGVSTKTIRRWLKADPTTFPGAFVAKGRIRIPAEDIDAFINARRLAK